MACPCNEMLCFIEKIRDEHIPPIFPDHGGVGPQRGGNEKELSQGSIFLGVIFLGAF